MMKKILLSLTLLGVLSCSPSSPKLEYKVFGDQVQKGVALDFNPKVDILFVVDDSGSMDSHQGRLSKNIDTLTQSIDRNKVIDYHIGVITSSMDSYYGSGSASGGRLVSKGGAPRFVDRNTVNGMNYLRSNLMVGTNGSATEEFFAPVQAALSSPLLNADNAGFYRPDATLVVIFITDAEDQSDENYSGPRVSVDDYYNFVLSLKNGDATKVVQYGIVIPTGVAQTSDCPRDDGRPPVRIESAIQMLKGFEYNLCDSNYNSNLDVLGKDIVNRVSRTLYLTRRPVPSTIVVKYGTEEIPNDIDKGWTYDPEKNAIVFGQTLMESLQGTSNKMDIQYTAVPDDM